jgi:hypothetical protein
VIICLYGIQKLIFIIEAHCVFCELRSESFVYDVDSFCLLKGRYIITIIHETCLFMNIFCVGTDFKTRY